MSDRVLVHVVEESVEGRMVFIVDFTEDIGTNFNFLYSDGGPVVVLVRQDDS